MNTVFLKLLRMSLETGLLVCVILLLRIILFRAPKWIFPLLWAAAGLRMILPCNISIPLPVTSPEANLSNGFIPQFIAFDLEKETFVPGETHTDVWTVC